MKKVKLFSFALAALMLGACTNEDVIDNGGQPQWNDKGKGYINLAIQLPTQPSTRANDNFDDGTPAEYEVKDATLILFVNDVVNSAYKMDLNFSPEGTATDNITTTAKITQEINKIDDAATANIKALVVLNNNDVFTIGNDNSLLVNNLSVTGKNLSELNDAINGIIGTNYNWHKDGFLMSNAVMANAAGGMNDPSGATVVGPLVVVDGSKIKSTKAEADANPAATIYVERAEAKVTLTAADGTVTDGTNFAYEIEGWTLDNTNQTNKLVRSVTGFDTWKNYTSSKLANPDYRFIGNATIAAGLYRVYWGDDYNYDSDGTFSTVGGDYSVLGTVTAADGESPLYCFENTTDLATMLEKNLTRVIVKVKFNNGAGFYTLDGNRDVMWTEENLKKEIAARLLTDVTFYEWAKANVEAGQTLSSETDFDVLLSTEAAGKRTVAGITINATGQAKLKDDAMMTYPANAAELANNHISFEYYAGGMAYYPVYIKHFGDDQTPRSVDDQPGSSIYGGVSADYLGRYGVLRNNWYDLNVTSIKSLGSPNVEEVTNEPVDKKESYISVQINVLSWAKRTQNVDL